MGSDGLTDEDRRVDAVVDWLLDQGRLCSTVEELATAAATRLRTDIPLDRLWIGTTVLHPQAAAWVWIWSDEGSRTLELSYDRFARMQQRDSPARRLRRGASSVRYRAGDGIGEQMPDVVEQWERGFVELYGTSLFFRGEWVGGFTFATRTGFSDADVRLFDRITPALSAVVEPLARDRVLATLLQTYLGDDAGSRVAAGQVRRGDGETIEAAIWFSDVRGFTALSASRDRQEVLDLLNDVSEAIHAELRTRGGQILKFIGDGILAVFTDPDLDRACEHAREAALAVQTRLSELRREREAEGRPGPRVGIGLHVGEVMYGNIGAPVRLDFTVIGEAVNLAARVEGLCGKLEQEVLATRAFADRTGTWESCGEYDLKGVPRPVEVSRPATP